MATLGDLSWLAVQSYLLGTRPNSGMVTHVVDRMARLGWDAPEWAR